MDEQREKRKGWFWLGGVVVLAVLLVVVFLAVRPWARPSSTTATGGEKANSGQTLEKGNGKSPPLPQAVTGLWDPLPAGILPPDPAPYSSRFRVVPMGEAAKAGDVELKVLKVRYASTYLPNQDTGSGPFKDQGFFEPIIAVDVTMTNHGRTPLQLEPAGRRFGFVQVLPDGSVKAVGSAVNDLMRYRYKMFRMVSGSIYLDQLVGAPYRDIPPFLRPGQSASFTVLLQTAVYGNDQKEFGTGRAQYGLTLSPDAQNALVQGQEQSAHAWCVADLGNLTLVRNARDYEEPAYPASPLPNDYEKTPIYQTEKTSVSTRRRYGGLFRAGMWASPRITSVWRWPGR
ncbi:MAG: hypothetical protein IMX00_11435 [Limnochordales bacterium]|nr:hypothetical protein [Limnochordales bacterium]